MRRNAANDIDLFSKEIDLPPKEEAEAIGALLGAGIGGAAGGLAGAAAGASVGKPLAKTTMSLATNPIEDMPGGSVSGCIEMYEDDPDIRDAGAYCAAIADRIEPGWREGNPNGSRGWSALGAFMGGYMGVTGGTLIARRFIEDPFTSEDVEDLLLDQATDERKAELRKNAVINVALSSLGGTIMGAAGAAIGAPPELRRRAAIGAAIGGAVPMFGAPFAALGTFIATRPDRRKNPMSSATTAALAILAILGAGGLAYVAVKKEEDNV